jgi:hypothetical protein
MASLRMIDGNLDALRRYEEEHEQDEARIEFVSGIISDIDNVISEIDEYDTEDNADLCNRIEKAIEDLRDLIGRLEGER